MGHAKRLILGCVMGISAQKDTDWNRWQLPISLEYCAADRPLADRLQRSEEMVRLEAAGFVPLAIVATDANGHAGPALMIGHDTPGTIRQYLLQQAQQIFEEALERESDKATGADDCAPGREEVVRPDKADGGRS